MIMGGDNLATIEKWKNYEFLLKEYTVYLYSRPDYDSGKFADHPNVRQFDAPQMEISSSYIRKCIKDGKSIQYLVPDAVFEYIDSGNMYQ